MKTPLGLLAALSLCVGGCAGTATTASNVLTPWALNNNAAEYDGQKVTVKGWLEYGDEQHHLFQSKPSSNSVSGVYDNRCTSVKVPEKLSSAATELTHQYVLIEGVFRTDIAGGDIVRGRCNVTGIQVTAISRAS
jgi:hypothetical protein